MNEPEIENGHVVNDENCWCNPDVYQICPMCGGSPEGCSFCLGQHELPPYPGLVPEYDEDQVSIIVHQDV